VTGDLVLHDRRDATLTLTLNRPEKLNALSTAMLEELDAALDDAEGDGDVRVIVITGGGDRAFVAGADIGEYAQLDHSGFVAYQRRCRELFTRIDAFGAPVIGAINGYAFGGGFEIALCCDMLIASSSAVFALPEGLLGLCPGGGGTQRLARAVGPFVANDVLLSARRLTADEAHALGLVAEVVEAGELLEAARAKAAAVAKIAPLAARTMAELVRTAGDADLERGLDDEQAALATLRRSHDADEGIRAFVEKREPGFRGA
jgi:enoyl-CoA hydratase/carnithine racemase